MATPGWEQAQRAVQARMETGLPAALQRIEGQTQDGVPLPGPAVYRLYPLEVEDRYPAVYILPGVATPDRQTAAWADVNRGVTVVVRHRAESPLDLSLALVRYEQAVLEVVRGQGVVDPNMIVHWSESRPAPFFEMTGQDEHYESAIQVSFVIKQVEELT